MKKPSGQEMKFSARRAGFTLIELLTVIAIISVLAGMTAVAVPRYLEKAQTTKAVANIDAVAKAISAKAAETGNTGGYPPAYGFILPEARERTLVELLANPELYYQLKPYTAEIGLHQEFNVYELERWTTFAYDSNGDQQIGLLEYCPVGERNPATNAYTFSTEMYEGPAGEFAGTGASNDPFIVSLNEMSLQRKDGAQRPFVYVPFNSRQLAAVRRYWLDSAVNDPYGENIDLNHPLIQGRIFFPAPQYDGFVLIGNGPGGDNGGVVTGPPAGAYDSAYVYHMAALRVAFLATRDLDGDSLLDFEFRDRRQATTIHQLPPNTANRNGFGAFIKVVQ